MASIRKVYNTWIACLTLGDGSRTERSTGIKDLGQPKERAESKREAIMVAQEMEESVRGNKTETQIRKTITDLAEPAVGARFDLTQTIPTGPA